MRSIFSSFDTIVTSVDNAKAATTLIADTTKRFDLLICDYHLGEGENGLSVLHESLRRYKHKVGVILISGEIQIDMEGSEAIPLLRKPIEPDKLLATAQLQLGTRA